MSKRSIIKNSSPTLPRPLVKTNWSMVSEVGEGSWKETNLSNMYPGPEAPKRSEGFFVKFDTLYNPPIITRASTVLPHNTTDKFSNRSNLLEVAQGGMPHKYVKPSLERFAKYVMPHFRDV